MGDETELYEGEIKDILLSVLVDACKNVPAGSRRADVINDIIRKNGYQHLAEKLEKRIKELFRGYKTMNGAMRQELQAMDFTITEDGSHYKLTYHGDPRYDDCDGQKRQRLERREEYCSADHKGYAVKA